MTIDEEFEARLRNGYLNSERKTTDKTALIRCKWDGILDENFVRCAKNQKGENTYSIREFEKAKAVMNLLKSGLIMPFAECPEPKGVKELFEELKKSDFIGKEAELASFKVTFGIPLPYGNTFIKTRWLKNRQLFRYFMKGISFPNYVFGNIEAELFSDKYGKSIYVPDLDSKRLEESSDFEELKQIINRFKTR